MKIHFIKMHAQGNDFIILKSDENSLGKDALPQLAIDVCDRHFGLGADGLVLLDTIKPEMLIYNSDGSQPEMCGSALRCCSYLLTEQSGKKEIEIHTFNGLSKAHLEADNPRYVTVEIGKPELVEADLTLEGFTGSYINIGNPHFVVFQDSLTDELLNSFGKSLSENPHFPNGANMEFVRILTRKEIELIVWERGAGPTLACGTGAVAAVFAGIIQNWLDNAVTVNLPGGKVLITKRDDMYLLGGEVSFVASGVYVWKA